MKSVGGTKKLLIIKQLIYQKTEERKILENDNQREQRKPIKSSLVINSQKQN